MSFNEDDIEESFHFYHVHPSILFCRPDKAMSIRRLHFVLSLHHREYRVIEELVTYCGGIVTCGVDNVTGHSIIIVDHDELESESIPAFRVDFIDDCLKYGKMRDILDYRQERSKGIRRDLNGGKRGSNLMEVVYYYTMSWYMSPLAIRDVMRQGLSHVYARLGNELAFETTASDNTSELQNNDIIIIEDEDDVNCTPPGSRSLSESSNANRDTPTGSRSFSDSSNANRDTPPGSRSLSNSCKANQNTPPGSRSFSDSFNANRDTPPGSSSLSNSCKANQNTPPGSRSFSDSSNANRDTPPGSRSLSNSCKANQNTPPGSRSFSDSSNANRDTPPGSRSLSNSCKANQNTPPGLRSFSDSFNANRDTPPGSSSLSNSCKANQNTPPGSRSFSDSSNANRDTPPGSSSLSNSCKANQNTPPGSRSFLDSSNANRDTPPGSSSLSNSWNANRTIEDEDVDNGTPSSSRSLLNSSNTKRFYGAVQVSKKSAKAKKKRSDSAGWMSKHTGIAKKKRTRREYTFEDREIILNYIISTEQYDRVKGIEMWKEMETNQALPGRTWQSLKEHYLKKIVPNLNSFPFLTNAQKRDIKRQAY